MDPQLDDYNARTFGVLKKLDMTLAEHYLLGTVGCSIYLPVKELAQHTRDLVEGDSRGNFSEQEYLQAFNSCVAKAWLQVITPKAHEAELQRRYSPLLPELLGIEPQVGEVGFMEQGALAYRQSILEIFGQDHIHYNDSGWNFDKERCEFEILAPNREYLEKRVDELSSDPSSCTGLEVVLVSVGEPEPVGQWKPTRFITLSHGFRCTVVCRPV
jgi:hypothetical protein